MCLHGIPGEDVYVWRHAPSAARHCEFPIGPELRAEWEDECLNFEISNFETWKSACGLWRQSSWISKRVTVAASSRADAERARTLAQPPQQNPARKMAISLEQPLTVEAPVEEETTELSDPPVTPEQSGEHAGALTLNAALLDPIGGSTIDTDTETLVPSPARRASVGAATPPAEISPRSRHKTDFQ